MNNLIVKIENNKTYGLVVSSNSVAEKLGVLHKDLLEKIDTYVEKFKEFSLAELSALFYIPSEYKARNGKTNRNYLITKKGIAQLISGYNAAVPIAFALNVAYINRFDEMEQILRNRSNSDWLLTRKDGKLTRRMETDAIQDLIPYAVNQGSRNANMLYVTYSKLVNKLVGIEANSRDKANYKDLINIRQLEDLFTNVIKDAINNKIFYKEIYQICKARGQELVNLVNYNGNLLRIVS